MSRRASRSRILSLGALGLVACAAAVAEERFRFPGPGASFAAGATVEAAWSAPCNRHDESEAELVLSLDDGLTFPVRLTGEMPPCVSSREWRVPDVPTSRARLALRKGRDEPGEEHIVAVSERFTIVGSANPEATGLTRGAVEWWTQAALAEFEAEDFLDRTLGRAIEWSERRTVDGVAVDSGPGALRPRRPSGSGLLVASSSRPAVRRASVARVSQTLPLRL